MSGSVEGLKHVRAAMEHAAHSAGRDTASIKLVAVSKTFTESDIVPVIEAGQMVFGENRVQEAAAKWPALRDRFDGIELHLIGPLQSNKAAQAVALFDVIQTVDREKIAKALSDEMQKQNRNLPCYVQVNTGNESQKAGIASEDVVTFVTKCRDDYGLNIIGLMCIPPVDENPGPHFALLEKLARQAGVDGLSMGMSSDYETAIAFGASCVRVGSAIFGYRDYT